MQELAVLDKMKDCPFCGKDGEVGVQGFCLATGTKYAWKCWTCGMISKLCDTKQEAIALGQSRPIEDQLRSQLEYCSARCRSLEREHEIGSYKIVWDSGYNGR